MDKKNINIEIDKQLWKSVTIKCAEKEVAKRQFVESALQEKLDKEK